MICKLKTVCLNRHVSNCTRCAHSHDSNFKRALKGPTGETCLNCEYAGEFACEGSCADCSVIKLDLFLADQSKIFELIGELNEIKGGL